MSLYSDWRNYLENLTDDQAEGFQHDYYEQEEKLYQKLLAPVSYTHLDVYKRQQEHNGLFCGRYRVIL